MIEIQQDTIDRLFIGRATEGDQLLAAQALQSILSSPHVVAEPVAWRVQHKEDSKPYDGVVMDAGRAEFCRARYGATITPLYAHPAPQQTATPEDWPKIEHPHRPKEADREVAQLKKAIQSMGAHQAIAIPVFTFALMQPTQGSLAGHMWALYECLSHMLTAVPTPPLNTQDGVDERQALLTQIADLRAELDTHLDCAHGGRYRK